MPWHPTSSSRSASAAAKEFDRLIRPHVRALYRSAYRWTGNMERAEDLVQELLVRLFPKLDELRTINQVRPWALRVMYRIFVDQVRRERSSPVEFGHDPSSDNEDDEALPFVDPQGDTATIVERQLTQERILWCGVTYRRNIGWYCRCMTSKATASWTFQRLRRGKPLSSLTSFLVGRRGWGLPLELDRDEVVVALSLAQHRKRAQSD